jgi:uncharacterized protein (DUF1499 family)
MRRAIRPVLVGVTILVAGIATGGAMGLFAGKRPESLGVAAGRLAPCKPSPNCVSSQADPSDAIHYVAPIAAGGDPARTFTELKRVVRATERVQIATDRPDYLYAEYRSRLFGFVDDVEFWLDPRAALIHVRSASRLGYGDFGVNRDRIERIRAALAAA